MPKKIRTCIVCGKGFIGKYPGKRGNIVCSEECRRKRIVESKLKGEYMKCGQCDKDVWVKPYKKANLKKGVIYCSKECQSEARKARNIKKICKQCGKEYMVTPAHSYSSYCSKGCHDKGQITKVMVNCTICGREVERIPSWVKKSNAVLCSEKCYRIYFLERVVFFQSHTNTKPERMFNEQTPDHIDQTSDGKYYVNFKNGKIKNPDFIVRPVNQTRMVIEIFGRYWHKPEEEQELIDLYKEAGYACLVIWEEEVYEGTYHDKLQSFLDKALCRPGQ